MRDCRNIHLLYILQRTIGVLIMLKEINVDQRSIGYGKCIKKYLLYGLINV